MTAGEVVHVDTVIGEAAGQQAKIVSMVHL
jgi:hypothetical protein